MWYTEIKTITARSKNITPFSKSPNSRWWSMNEICRCAMTHTISRNGLLKSYEDYMGFRFRQIRAYGKNNLKVVGVGPIVRMFSINKRSNSKIPISKLRSLINR